MLILEEPVHVHDVTVYFRCMFVQEGMLQVNDAMEFPQIEKTF